ncbi:vacuolar ATP synthase-like protein subunit C 1 [Calycina marina]|uniref:V-type proton ATPase subunit C n=1 Tax=Calycina marina TaxID=1763456 RepID=A0A9P8CGA9_9HELO|nr:vacuolar ATP synthase-like protein subunit C 1 [Calycina marina]
MSSPTKYMLVSLPTTISSSSDKEDALTTLRSTVTIDSTTVLPFKIPEFKIGAVDVLLTQADDLGKLEASCGAVVAKIGDTLRSLLEGDEEKISQQKTVNDKPADQYLRTFGWNKVKYRADKPIVELMSSLQKELVSIDNDVKGKITQYNQIKTNLTALERKQNGNLATKSLTPVVDPKLLVQESEYLETHLVVVPTTQKKEFLKSYETLAPMVVPRSSIEVTHDDEFTLYTVTTFKKTSAEFQRNCREMKWTPRDFKYVKGGQEQEKQEVEKVQRDERKVWGEALRLSRTGWSESVMIWVHVLTLRVFAETVLRYGLPLDYVCGLVMTPRKQAKKAKDALDKAYSYLGGNSVGRDSKGRVVKDDSALSSDMAAAGVGGEGEYTPYVYYEFEMI